MAAGSSYERIYDVVRRIPKGRVATYGQIAVLAGLPGHARQVGYALSALPDGSDVPWHRVINAHGRVSTRSEGFFHSLQRNMLEAEGVTFDAAAKISLRKHGWSPRSLPSSS